MFFYHISLLQRDNHRGGGKEKLKNKKPTFPLPCVFPSALSFPHPTPLSAFYFVCGADCLRYILCVFLFIIFCKPLCVQTKNEERNRGRKESPERKTGGKGDTRFCAGFLSPFPRVSSLGAAICDRKQNLCLSQ